VNYTRWLKWITGWLLILLLYGVANLVLVGVQKLWHRSDEAKLTQLETLLKGERNQIEQLEDEMKACSEQDRACGNLLNQYSETDKLHKAELKKIAFLNQRVAQSESRARGCVPDESDCETQYGRYSAAVDTYNTEVRKANTLLRQLTAMRPQLGDCVETEKRCGSLSTEYSRDVDAYNAKLPEANALAKSTGTYWYVVPVPKFGSHASGE
jgi:chromosome segregation ATPase